MHSAARSGRAAQDRALTGRESLEVNCTTEILVHTQSNDVQDNILYDQPLNRARRRRCVTKRYEVALKLSFIPGRSSIQRMSLAGNHGDWACIVLCNSMAEGRAKCISTVADE